MKILQKIRTSFTTQLMSWVAAFVLVISGVVLLLLVRFSQNVIYDETTDATMQALENTALRINNTLSIRNIYNCSIANVFDAFNQAMIFFHCL